MSPTTARGRTREHFDVGGFFTERELDGTCLVEQSPVQEAREPEVDFLQRRAKKYVDAASNDFAQFPIDRALAGWNGKLKIVFRGQVDHRWGMNSSLARAVSSNRFHLADEQRLYDAEKRIIDAAKNRRGTSASPSSWLGLNMSDGELLAVLQHHEAPTRFIDVTEDPRVALYFAAEKEDRTDGRLFVIALKDEENGTTTDGSNPEGPWLALSNPNDPDDRSLPWPKPSLRGRSQGSWTNSVYLADAGSLDPRMKAQRGLFLVGGRIRAYPDLNMSSENLGEYLDGDTLPYVTSFAVDFRKSTNRQERMNRSTRAYAWTLRIPSELKPGIRVLLAKEGISHDSLFPDYREFKRLADSLARERAPKA